MNQQRLDDLARAVAATDDRSLSRRAAVKLAALSLVAAAPFGARTATAGAAPRGTAQFPNTLCLECKDRIERTYRRNSARCLTRPRIFVLQWCAFETAARRYIDAAKEGCFGKCQPLSEPPTPVPQPPITPQPMPTVSDDCLNCMAVGREVLPAERAAVRVRQPLAPVQPLRLCGRLDGVVDL